MSIKKTTMLWRRIRKVIDAEIADAFKGAGDPDDIPEIEHKLSMARMQLAQFVAGLHLDSRPNSTSHYPKGSS